MTDRGSTLCFYSDRGTIRKVVFTGGEMQRGLKMSRKIIFCVQEFVQRARGRHEAGPGIVGPPCQVSVVFEIREFSKNSGSKHSFYNIVLG